MKLNARRLKIVFIVSILSLIPHGSFLIPSPAHALTIPDLLQKIKENQGQVKTLQAEMTTTIQSSSYN